MQGGGRPRVGHLDETRLGPRDAVEVAEDLRIAVGKLAFGDESRTFAVTCSCGVAELEAEETIDQLLRRADMARAGVAAYAEVP